MRDCFRLARDPPKHALGLDPRVNRVGEEIIRSSNRLERDRTQNRFAFLLIARELDAPHVAACHLMATNLYRG
jgi:hypothetical protein